MSINKKAIRRAFRDACFKRDGFKCIMCGYKPKGNIDEELDAHHITDRSLLPNGGYVAENGVTLCNKPNGCHWKAEQFHLTGVALPSFTPDDLYSKIGSSYEQALKASEKLK